MVGCGPADLRWDQGGSGVQISDKRRRIEGTAVADRVGRDPDPQRGAFSAGHPRGGLQPGTDEPVGSRPGGLDVHRRHAGRSRPPTPASGSSRSSTSRTAVPGTSARARRRGRFVVMLTQDALPADRKWLAALLAPFADPQVVASYSRQVPRADANPMERFFLERRFPPGPPVRRERRGEARSRWTTCSSRTSAPQSGGRPCSGIRSTKP